MKTTIRMAQLGTLTAALLGAACSDSATSGSGTVVVQTWGEEYIEEKIPVTVTENGMTETIVEDGWEIRYSKFLVNFKNIKLQDEAGALAFESAPGKLVDHKKPGRKELFRGTNIAAKAWTKFSYQIAPVDATSVAINADPADLALMQQGKYSVYVAGELVKGTEKKSFAFGFATATAYDACEAESGGKLQRGVVVGTGTTANVELTVHGDHLFYDDLAAGTAKVRVDPRVTADKDNDGVISQAELEAVKVLDLRDKYGQQSFGVGSNSSVVNLWAFEQALSRTIGHFQGEGECLSSIAK
jgi:hypothetical protein